LTLSVPDEGYYVTDEGYYVTDEGYYVTDEGYYVTDEGYSRNASCALNVISIFIH
jgi:flagellar basal body rod protein FlgG